LVDAERAEARIERLEETIERLEEVRAQGEDAYLSDPKLQAMAERWLQTAIQACIDLGTQVVAEQSAPPPSNYADVFRILGEKGIVSTELAHRLGDAARQRNLLVHLYMEIDNRAVFASLAYLDDLRQFAAAVERLVDKGGPSPPKNRSES
jgi:uncharacterized protein YutE (UPF0331/DUF86 family)